MQFINGTLQEFHLSNAINKRGRVGFNFKQNVPDFAFVNGVYIRSIH
jgi:hypothetical protein